MGNLEEGAMRRITIPVLLFIILGLPACMISTQEGERTHVNSPAPDEITFHFNTAFNKVLLFGRSGALLLVALWGVSGRNRAGDNTFGYVIAAAALVLSGWLLMTGWSTVFSYRIEIRSDQIHLGIPSEPDQIIPWDDIDTMEGEGVAWDISIGDGKGQVAKWAPEWEDMTITLQDGRKRDVDLRPLSVEQRGTLLRAIVRLAHLSGKEWVEPAKR